jgi:hypothetical protein
MFGIPISRLTPTNEAFVAHGHARSLRDGLEAVSDRRLARALEGVLIELSRHDQLSRGIDLGKLATAAISGAVGKVNGHTPLAADAEVCFPVLLAIKIRVAPPAFDLVRRKCLKDALGRRGNFGDCDDGPAPAIDHGSRRAPFRSGWQSEISFTLPFACHLVLPFTIHPRWATSLLRLRHLNLRRFRSSRVHGRKRETLLPPRCRRCWQEPSES